MAVTRHARFGDLLKRYRVAAGLTQEELAERAGLSAKGISDLERGARTNPRRDTVALLADALSLADRDRATLEAAARQRGELSSAPLIAPAVPRAGLSHTAPPLAGRGAERALIARHLDGDGPPLLAFAGEPGIGKSRLLREAAEQAAERGWAVLSGGCNRRSGQEPFAPFSDIVAQSLAPLSSAARQARLQGCARLARLAPEIAELEAGIAQITPLAPEQERRLTFAAFARYLANVAGPAGVLLALDDIQWAGQDTLDLLAYSTRTETACPLRIVAAYRDTEVRSHHPLATLLADLAREGLAARTLLAPLANADAEWLIETLLPDGDDSLRRRLLQRAGGLPFFLVSCAQGLSSGALSAVASGGDIPWSVSETIRQRVAALPEPATAVLRIAALACHHAPRKVLLGVAASEQLEEEEARAALDAACAARLLQEDGPDTYDFPHDLVREVIAGDVSAAWRALLHRRIATIMELEPGAAPELLAYHYERSDERDKALVYLERAGDQALARYANAEAIQLYRQLIEGLTARGQTLAVADIQERMAGAVRRQGHQEAALTLLEAAADAWRQAGEREREAQARAEAGVICASLSKTEEGLALLEPFLAQSAEAAPSSGLSAVYAALSRVLYSSSFTTRVRFDEQLAAAERAVEIARAVGDEQALVEAEDCLAQAMFFVGRGDHGETMLRERVIAVAERQRNTYTLSHAYLDLGVCAMERGDFALNRQCIEKALDMSERTDSFFLIAYAIFRRGDDSFITGDWRAARGDLERALALMRQRDLWRYSGAPTAWLARLCLAEGKWDEAAEHAAQIVQQDRQASHTELLWRAIQAERDLLRGEPATARERLALLLGEPFTGNWIFNDLRALMAWALAESGEIAPATALIQEILARARASGHRPRLSDALWHSARIALLAGDVEQAQAALDESVVLARTLPQPYTEVKALYTYGLLHETRGEPDAARKRFEAALAICARLGERLYAEHIERALESLAR